MNDPGIKKKMVKTMMQEKTTATMSKRKPLMRTYRDSQYQRFEHQLQKKYPDLWHTIHEQSEIVFAMYESGLFFTIME
jgi:hypothetical protein